MTEILQEGIDPKQDVDWSDFTLEFQSMLLTNDPDIFLQALHLLAQSGIKNSPGHMSRAQDYWTSTDNPSLDIDPQTLIDLLDQS